MSASPPDTYLQATLLWVGLSSAALQRVERVTKAQRERLILVTPWGLALRVGPSGVHPACAACGSAVWSRLSSIACSSCGAEARFSSRAWAAWNAQEAQAAPSLETLILALDDAGAGVLDVVFAGPELHGEVSYLYSLLASRVEHDEILRDLSSRGVRVETDW